MKSIKIIGVDIGGSHIAGGLIDASSHQLIKSSVRRKKINPQGSAEQILNAWAGTIADILIPGQKDEFRLGIAMPGPFDYRLGIAYMNGVQNKYQSLYGLNIGIHEI